MELYDDRIRDLPGGFVKVFCRGCQKVIDIGFYDYVPGQKHLCSDCRKKIKEVPHAKY